MSEWLPMAVLPDLLLRESIGTDIGAFFPPDHTAVKEAGAAQPLLLEFLDRFKDAFGEKLHPAVLMLRHDAPPSFFESSAVAGLRDAVAVALITSGRAKSVRYDSGFNSPQWAETFSLYPWSLDKPGKHLITSTPALWGVHGVKQFNGQGTPGLPTLDVRNRDADVPLLDALLTRWDRRFAQAEALQDSPDARLFRSLNMAYHAMMMPAGVSPAWSFYDPGRLITLWASAFEILVRVSSEVGHRQVMDCLDRAPWLLSALKDRIKVEKTGDLSKRHADPLVS